jgi:hypothetical protein
VKENIESSRFIILSKSKFRNYYLFHRLCWSYWGTTVVSDISHIQHAAFFSGEKSPNGDTDSGEFLAKIPLFSQKEFAKLHPSSLGAGRHICRLCASYSFNNRVQKSDWNLVTLSQDPPINMESKWETSNIPNHLDQSFYPGPLVGGGGRGGLRNMICSFAPLWPTFGFCPFGWELGPPFLSLIFSPLLDALFNGVCQGFNQPFYLVNQQ